MTSEYQGYRNGHTAPLNTSHYRQKTRKTKSRPPEQGLSNGLIILVIAIVVGCFAVLWPKYFYPMMFGDPQPHPKYDPETMFMEGPHGREYLRNRLKERGPGHPGVHPGTGHNGDTPPPPHTGPGRATPPIRAASDGPMPGMRPMPGVHPGGQSGQPPSQEKGRGAMGYLMPIYTVAILILFVYTAMKLVFKKKPDSEEDEGEQRRARRRQRPREQGARYDEEYYNNLIRQEQQTQGSVVQEVTEPSSPVVSEPVETEIVEENKVTSVVDTDIRTNQSSTTPETRRVDENKEDKKDVEILMLQARLDQTEQTLQKLIGQMGALTASLANAGLVVSPDSDDHQEDTAEADSGDSEADGGHHDNDDLGHQDDESDSDDETDEESEEDVSESD